MTVAKLDTCKECDRLFVAEPGETLYKTCRKKIQRKELTKPKGEKND